MFVPLLNIKKDESFRFEISVFLILIFLSTVVRSQSIMSFVTLPPDARSLALGGATTALSPDSFSALRNPAQLVFLKGRVGAGYGYMPWMKNLHADLDLHVATVCLKIDHKQAVSVSCRYFSHMESEWTDEQGNVLGIIEPRDVALDFSYSRMIIRNLTGAITGRYISSYTGLGETMQAIAVDALFCIAMFVPINLFYQQECMFRMSGVGLLMRSVYLGI